MSNCRTFNRSSRKDQQPKPQNPGIIRVNRLAHDMIVANPEKFVKHFAHLFFEENKVTAGITIIKFGSGAVLQVSEEEGQARRPNLISKWVIECEQQDKDKKQNEAEAAQEAATRELGQIPEPEVAVETPVAASAIRTSTKSDCLSSASPNPWIYRDLAPAAAPSGPARPITIESSRTQPVRCIPLRLTTCISRNKKGWSQSSGLFLSTNHESHTTVHKTIPGICRACGRCPNFCPGGKRKLTCTPSSDS